MVREHIGDDNGNNSRNNSRKSLFSNGYVKHVLTAVITAAVLASGALAWRGITAPSEDEIRKEFVTRELYTKELERLDMEHKKDIEQINAQLTQNTADHKEIKENQKEILRLLK